MPFTKKAFPAVDALRKMYFLRAAFVGLLFLFVAASALPLPAYADDTPPTPDTSLQRPNFQGFASVVQPTNGQICVLNACMTVPPAWSCRGSGGVSPTTMCQSSDGNTWTVMQCQSQSYGGDGLGFAGGGALCDVYQGTGDRSVSRTPAVSSVTPTTNTTGTANVDPGTGQLLGSTSNTSTILDGLGHLAEQVTLGLVGIVILFVTEIINWLLLTVLAFVSWIFDIVVTEFVIQMGKYVTSETAAGVRTAWTIIRDFANIGIIGGLVATAIGTILGNDKYNVNQTLARILLAALLVNFSYFFAGAIIDVSNFTASQAYEHMVKDPNCVTAGECGPANSVLKSLALNRLTSFGNWFTAHDVTTGNSASLGQVNVLNQAVHASDQQNNSVDAGQNGHSEDPGVGTKLAHQAALNLMETFFIIAILFVLLSAISLLIARFIALIFLLVTSPVGIAGGAVPLLKNYADEWWKSMWSQAMFAPVYFFLLGIALTIYRFYTQVSFISPATVAQEALGNDLVTILGVIISMLLGIGFLLVALSTAKEMSAQAKQFKGLYDGVQKYITRPAAGAARYAAGLGLRESVGRLAYGAAFRYNRAAGERRWDQKGIFGTGTLLDKAAGRALDRSIKGALAGAQGAKFLADAKSKAGIKKGFAEMEKEKRERQTELGNIAREQEQDGKLKGRLIGDKKKRYKELGKKTQLDKEKEARWRELRKMERGGKLSKAEQAEMEKLWLDKSSGKKLTKEDSARLKTLQDKALMTRAEKNDLAALNEEKLAKFTDAAEREEWKELDGTVAGGGMLQRLKQAEALHRQKYNEGVNKQKIDEAAHYADLKSREGIAAGAEGALTADEREALKYYKGRENDQTRFTDLSARRNALNPGEEKELERLERKLAIPSARYRDLAGREARGEALNDEEKLELKKYNERATKGFSVTSNPTKESDAAYYARMSRMNEKVTYKDANGKEQTKTIEWGRKRGEDATAYYARLEKDELTGYRKAREEAERVEATLPKDFLQRKYAEDPRLLIPYAPILDAATFVGFMKDDNIARDIKREMRIARNGDYMNTIRDIDDRVKNGDLVKGSKEHGDLMGSAFYYTLKRLNDNEEYLDMVMSPQGEDLRAKETLTNGGSRTGAFLHTKGKLGPTERRRFSQYKRNGYLKPQRKLGAVAIIEGWDEKEADGATPKQNYFLKYQPGSDDFNETKEAIDWANEEIKEAQDILSQGNQDDAEQQRQIDRIRFAEMVRDPAKNPFAASKKNKFERTREIQKAVHHVEELWKEVDQLEGAAREERAQEVMDEIRGNDAYFIANQEIEAREGLEGFTEGKSDEEIAGLTSMERTHSRAIVVGNDANVLAGMMHKYDDRFKKAIRHSWFVEKDQTSVSQVATNHGINQAFGGWPPAEEIESINADRRMKAGFPPDTSFEEMKAAIPDWYDIGKRAGEFREK